MIVTVTPNPSLDLTLEIARLERGAVHRASGTSVEAGGKGVNVARALLANGHPVRAVLPVGGPEGEHHLALLAPLGLDVRPVPLAGSTRTNVSIVEPDGAVTKVNAAGPPVTAEEVEAVAKTVLASLDGARWLVASGALPPGAPLDLYARMTGDARAAGCRVALDTSGDALAHALDARPDVVKPNETELTAVVGRALRTLGDVVEAAEELRRRGAGCVLVSLGRDGAVLVDGRVALHARAPAVTSGSSVGAGDAAVAGFLAAGADGPPALRAAVAWGAAAARLPGTAMPGEQDIDIESVLITEVDADRALGGGL